MSRKISIESRIVDFVAHHFLRGVIIILLVTVCCSTFFWILAGFDNAVFARVLLMLFIPLPFALLYCLPFLFFLGYIIQVKYIVFSDNNVLIHYNMREFLLNDRNVFDIKKSKSSLPILYIRHRPEGKRKDHYYLTLLDERGLDLLLNWWDGVKKKPRNLLQRDGEETI